jgi:hypothetical protein
LPQFDLVVKNTGATTILVSNEEQVASSPDPITSCPVANTLQLGPYDRLMHPVTLYDSAAGAIACDVLFMWRDQQ